MTNRAQRIEIMKQRLAEISRAEVGMRDALLKTNFFEHHSHFKPIIERLKGIIEAEKLGFSQFIADDLLNVRSGIRRLPLPDVDEETGEEVFSVSALRAARGNLVEALDNALDAASELNMRPRDSDIGVPLVERSGVIAGLVQLDSRLASVDASLRQFASTSEHEQSLQGSQKSDYINFYIRKISLEISAARFETTTVEKVDLSALHRAVSAMNDLAKDLAKFVDNLRNKINAQIRDAGLAVANLATRAYKGYKTIIRSSIRAIIKRPAALASDASRVDQQPVVGKSNHSENSAAPSNNSATKDQTPAQLIVQNLPYLRRYARALAGSQASGDAYVAAALETLSRQPEKLEVSYGHKVALFKLFTQIWRGLYNEDRTNAIESDLPTEYRLSKISILPRQAFLLSCLEGFSEEEASDILDVDAYHVRDLVDEAGRELALDLSTNILIIEDDPLTAMDIETIVEGLGHNVIGVARTFSEAVKMAFLSNPPGMIISDIQLADGSSGLDAVNRILDTIQVPVIFITGYPERFLTGNRPEPAFLISKPFEHSQLSAVISQALFFQQNARKNSN